ncbi:CDP-diacylglycerol--serine O-phosphatidyltransferase [Vibrio ostreicida]|uniref:CDP-diacylglycerol--serine O-phosphatidyltransferase n=1 Tax=Vibrio ostreicida TaxID=526588 RepID=A0ABT8BMU2_9VIBR|nr:CDP-diacylglycerol--serine O-phosphatidyltransferase [Vibrio ostreicida]MDN3608462.1 CDP-diacylglycerol--serine O-phosphatidyltransferase [Vibrio ostreicida]MDN3611225.1 CDP-diacylglycerol--serine O-phosphatidyltransferase [Vibrio ostreicida]NPD10284.1 CDP-diacylglycerol--serine O-phosphatidyltransferase [Vibrio ostreicida]
MMTNRNLFQQLPTLAQDPAQFTTLCDAQDFRGQLIKAIQGASKRIYIVALYLEDDEAGREILTELYQAKQRNPGLEINVCVDWHRAQRGLIGSGSGSTNATMYQTFADSHQHKIPVYGVPVRGREVFGVLHLKGFIIDDTVIYSGASLNNIYLSYNDKYRFDRYHILGNSTLADSMVKFIQQEIITHPAVNDLNLEDRPSTKAIKSSIRQLRASLERSSYQFESQLVSKDQVAVTPLIGVGKKRNKLNQCIDQLLATAKAEIFICTPYFNLPHSVAKQVKRAIKRGVKVTIVVGDKTANDFYIPPEAEFKTIGGLPYLYERNLRQFAKANEANIASRNLSIHLWKHDDNSFHLKGVWVDKQYMLITGNNLNPRAWKLDLENAILIQDNHQHLCQQFEKEVANILQHTQMICTYKQIEKFEDYPLVVKKLMRKITRVKADSVLKQIL